MNIPKEKLGLLGISIKANRKTLLKKTKAAKWTQLHFVEDICSPNTLTSIEHGRPSRFPNLYEQLAQKLSMDVKYNPELDSTLLKLSEKLYHAVDYHDNEKIKYHCNRALELLKNYTNALWYSDYYKVIKLIKEYHLKGILLSSDGYEYYIDLLDGFSYHINEIIKSIIISSAFEDISSKNYYDTYDKLEIGNSTSIFNEINQLLYFFSLSKTSKFQEKVKLLEKKCKKVNNYIRLLDTYNLSITYFSYFDQDAIDGYAKKIECLIKEKEDIVGAKLYDIYFGLGTAYHKIGRYEDSIKCLWKSYSLDVNKIKRTFLFLANSQRKLGLSIELPYYSDKELSKFPLDDKLMYKYYTMESEGIPVMFRQKFLMEKILPNLHGSDEICIGIMKEELSELVQITNQYKDLVIYEIKVRELIQNEA